MDSLCLPQARVVEVDARISRRTAAFLVDLLLVWFVIAAPLSIIFAPLAEGSFSQIEAGATALQRFAAMLLFMLVWLYLITFEYLLRQTPGMVLLGLRVAGPDGWWRLALRNCFIIPIFPIILLWVVEPIVLLMRGRRWLEWISNTRTVEEVVI